MKKNKFLARVLALLAAFSAIGVKAQNLPVTFDGVAPGLPVHGTFYGSDPLDLPSGVSSFGNMKAFCVEPTEPLEYGESLVYQIQDSASLANHDTISKLVGGFLASPQDERHAAAVQWAIWEVVLDGVDAPSFATGQSRIVGDASQDIALLASDYLANVSSYSPASLTYLTSATRQDVVTWSAVPEPSSAGLISLSGLMLLRRRR
jgi:hypothetical protein